MAQTCTMVCNDQLNLGVDPTDCSGEVTIDAVFPTNAAQCPAGSFTVVLEDANGNAVPNPFDGSTYIGQVLTFMATDANSGNTCDGIVVVSDNFIPDLSCTDFSVDCDETDLEPDANNAMRPFPLPMTAVVSPSTGTGPFTVSNFDNCSDVTLTYTDRTVLAPMCSGATIGTIAREWTAIDASGNSSQCTQTITINGIGINDVADLPDYDDIDQPALDCTLRETDPGNTTTPNIGWNAIDPGDIFGDEFLGHPSPFDDLYPDGTVRWFGTGVPEVGTCNNLSFTFNDVRINHCPAPSSSNGCFKIIRTWTILEWCTGEIRTISQLIKVKDDEGPTISGLSDVTVSAGFGACTGTWTATVPVLTDSCSDADTYTVTASAGSVQFNTSSQRYVISDLPLGTYEVYYDAEDCCGNSTLDTINLTVTDQTPPIPVCHNVGVSLTSAGFGAVTASSLDGDDSGGNASFDNCADPVFFKVIRMDNLLGTQNGSSSDQSNSGTCDSDNGDDDGMGTGNQIWFDDAVQFCCEDAGKSIPVILRVFDVDPGSGPVHPDSMTVGFLQNRFNDCMVSVTVMNNLPPVFSCPADRTLECTTDISTVFDEVTALPPGDSTFYVQPNGSSNDTSFVGFFSVSANCGSTKVYIQDAGFLDDCNVSVVSASDNTPSPIIRTYTVVDGSQAYSCTQAISVINSDPFDQNDITFPTDFELFIGVGNCDPSIDPDSLAMDQVPQFTNTSCAKILSAPSDDVFERDDFNTPAEPGVCRKIIRTWSVREWCQRAGPWEMDQAILIKDTVGPVLTCPSTITVNADAMGAASVDVTVTVTDNCTGTFDNTNVAYLITPEGQMTIAGTGLTASNVYPVGTHTVEFIAVDSCGLSGQCTTTIEVIADPCDDLLSLSNSLKNLGFKQMCD
ncbi:MAG: hypothetical protein AAFP19_03180, partial [Bacteroidota bacterium]